MAVLPQVSAAFMSTPSVGRAKRASCEPKKGRSCLHLLVGEMEYITLRAMRIDAMASRFWLHAWCCITRMVHLLWQWQQQQTKKKATKGVVRQQASTLVMMICD